MGLFKREPNRLSEKADDLKASEIEVHSFMETPVAKLGPSSSIRQAIATFSIHKISGAPVVNEMGHLLGMISEYDLLIQAASRDLDSAIEYKTQIIGLLPTDTLKTALVLLYKNRIRRLPVVDNTGKLLGMVSRLDVLMRITNQP